MNPIVVTPGALSLSIEVDDTGSGPSKQTGAADPQH